MGGRLDFTAKFRDLQVMEDVKKKAELGWFEMDFTVYGTAYLKDGEMNYTISSDAGKIYQFIEEAAFNGIYCSDVMEETYKRLVPLGMKEEVLLDVKKQLAYQLYKTYPKELFVVLEKIAKEIQDDSAYQLLLNEKEKLEGLFDEHKLKYFRRLVNYCYSLQRLNDLHHHELLHWIDIEEKCIEDSFVTKDVFEKTFYGVAYFDGAKYKYIEDSVAEYIYRKKNELDEQGIFTSPVFTETLWYNYVYTLKDCRKQFSQLFRDNMNDSYLSNLANINQNKRVLNDADLRDNVNNLSEGSHNLLQFYLQKWNTIFIM